MRKLSREEAEADFDSLIRYVNEEEAPVYIGESDAGAVMVSQEYWQGLGETLLLERSGVMQKVREREADGSGFSDIGDLDWSSI
ncbi:hypothetical protein WN59_09695 [Salinicoccus sediminis]|uniref:Antitoxin n=1 Tax=Salinicoccus sediminis TaxID=1432562 RepID=A0A0M2SJP4_9STAP|nr:hypothetical protein [Salinicoccus sediminis]KKK33876.1 hypothetical protein WN59_09695 [Salinicoccus sediminis]